MAVTEQLPADLHVAVLYGGVGVEREVSLESGAAVASALEQNGLRVTRVDVSGDPAQIETLACDIAFLVLHGEFGEDGQVQAILEARGIPYTGSSSVACRVAMDKDASKLVLVEHGIPTASWVAGSSLETIDAAMRSAGVDVPCVIKPVSRGSSVGVTILKDRSELATAVKAALAVDERAMAESFVAGPEVTAGILDGQVLPLIELRPAREFYDYTAKYTDCGTSYLCPAPLESTLQEEIRELAARTAQCLNVRGFGRVDFMCGEDGPMVLEVNMIPGFTAHSLLPMAAGEAGIDFASLCLRILELGWTEHRHGGK